MADVPGRLAHPAGRGFRWHVAAGGGNRGKGLVRYRDAPAPRAQLLDLPAKRRPPAGSSRTTGPGGALSPGASARPGCLTSRRPRAGLSVGRQRVKSASLSVRVVLSRLVDSAIAARPPWVLSQLACQVLGTPPQSRIGGALRRRDESIWRRRRQQCLHTRKRRVSSLAGRTFTLRAIPCLAQGRLRQESPSR